MDLNKIIKTIKTLDKNSFESLLNELEDKFKEFEIRFTGSYGLVGKQLIYPEIICKVSNPIAKTIFIDEHLNDWILLMADERGLKSKEFFNHLLFIGAHIYNANANLKAKDFFNEYDEAELMQAYRTLAHMLIYGSPKDIIESVKPLKPYRYK